MAFNEKESLISSSSHMIQDVYLIQNDLFQDRLCIYSPLTQSANHEAHFNCERVINELIFTCLKIHGFLQLYGNKLAQHLFLEGYFVSHDLLPKLSSSTALPVYMVSRC